MQPIIILGLVAAAAITMSSGFLLTDSIDVWLQAIGFGSAVAVDPVEHVSVDIDINKQLITVGPNAPYYDNIITECSFHIAQKDIKDQNMDQDLTNDGVEEVICKLTENGVVKGEVSKLFQNGGKISCTQVLIGLNPGPPPVPIFGNSQIATDLNHFCPSQHYVLPLTAANWADGSPATIQEWTDVLIVVRGQNPTNVLP